MRKTKTMLESLALSAVLALSAFAVIGCERQGPLERAGEEIDDAVEQAGEAAEDVREEVEEAVEEIRDN